MTVLVLGGGVSGLSVAYYLSKTIQTEIKIWEASQRIGGWIKSQRNDSGVIFEKAARTLRPRSISGANTLKLLEELQLTNEIVPIPSSSPAAKNRLIYANGKLHPLPTSILALFKRTPPFSKPLVFNLLNEFRIPNKKISDEPIYDFIERRLGSEVADYLISPLICGISAGNAKEVSVNFIAEQLFNYEQEYGSITKGIISNFRNKKSIPQSSLLERVKKEKWNVYSFKDGLEVLPKRLHEVVVSKGVQLELDSKCDKIEFTKNNVILHNKMRTEKVDHVFCTILSENLAELVEDQHPVLSKLLGKIPSVNVAIVNLQFKGNLIKDEGFGFLVPPKEKLPILGVIYDSCCFKQDDTTVLTVMMGGYWFEKYFKNFEKEQYYDTALSYVKKILNISENPTCHEVTILEKCIPQYTVGHKSNVTQIHNYIKDKKLPLSVCGMSYNGVGVNDVILSAKNITESYIQNIK